MSAVALDLVLQVLCCHIQYYVLNCSLKSAGLRSTKSAQAKLGQTVGGRGLFGFACNTKKRTAYFVLLFFFFYPSVIPVFHIISDLKTRSNGRP